jgi:hypothetical protein
MPCDRTCCYDWLMRPGLSNGHAKESRDYGRGVEIPTGMTNQRAVSRDLQERKHATCWLVVLDRVNMSTCHYDSPMVYSDPPFHSR